MSTLQKFFANIQSFRDNGSPIELNLRGTHYSDPGKYSGPPEDCYEAETETTVTECKVVHGKKNYQHVICLTVDFYDFTETEQARFLEAALACIEPDE